MSNRSDRCKKSLLKHHMEVQQKRRANFLASINPQPIALEEKPKKPKQSKISYWDFDLQLKKRKREMKAGRVDQCVSLA